MKNCVFCKIIRGELPATKVYEDDRVIAFLDIAPLTKGHTIVVPKAHHTSVTSLPAADGAAIMAAAPRLGAALMRATDGDGFNLLLANGACAGQVVPHVHLHVIPRHAADGIVFPGATVAYADAAERDALSDAVRQRLAETAE